MKEFFKKSVLAILTFEAQLLLRRKKPKIIAITGSVGKTSTKDAVYAVLKNHVHARKSEKSFNSDIGVVLTVLGLHNGWNNPLLWFRNIIDGMLHALFSHDYPDVLILEMGVDRKGDMKRLTNWIKPDITIVTCLPDVPAHIEFFSSPEEIIVEKMTLVYALKKDGIFIYNADDAKIHTYLHTIPQRSFGYGKKAQTDFMVGATAVIYDGASPIGFEFALLRGTESAKVQLLGSLGVQHAYTYAAAAAVGFQFGISLTDAIVGLNGHTPPQGRMRVLQGSKGTTVIDDTYNSSPIACAHAIETLGLLKKNGRKIAVLGDMLELGQLSVQEHERLGALVATNVDILFTLGVRSHAIAQGALASSMSKNNIFEFDDIQTLIDALTQYITKDDIVLVKASQGIRAERVVKAIMAEPQKAKELLVRQDSAWNFR